MEAGRASRENRQLIKLHYLPARNKKAGALPLLLIHGWASSSRVWQPLVEALIQKRDLWFIDLPACGDNDYVDDFTEEELLAELKLSLPGPCVLLGWSLGGMLATQLAAACPREIRALILLATNRQFVASDNWPWAMKAETFQHFYAGFAQNAEATFKRFIALQALGDADKKGLLKSLEQLMSPPGKKQYRGWSRLLDILSRFDNSETLKKISCPGLHLFAENDALVPCSAATHIYSSRSHQKVEVLPSCGHALHLSQTEWVSEKINYFIEQCENGHKGKERIAQAFGRAALQYDAVAKLQREVAEKLVKMEATKHSGDLNAKTILDLGCGTGFVSDFLMQQNPGHTLVLADLSAAMCRSAQTKLFNKYALSTDTFSFITADMDALPFAPESLDCVISSMSMQWSESTEALLAQLWSCLKPGGRVLFSTVGEATLKELSSAWQEVDDYVHVNTFLSAAALRTMAEEQHFRCEHMQSELREQGFNTVIELMKNLKTIGAHTVNAGLNHGLTSRARLQALEHAYEKFRNQENLLPATWEIHYFVLSKHAKEKD